MRNPKIKYLLALFCCSLSLPGCVTLAGWQTAQTLGKNNVLLSSSLNLSGYSRDHISTFLIPTGAPGEGEHLNSLYFETATFYGLNDRLDIGVRANTGLFTSLEFKHRLFGNEFSKAAISWGSSLGIYGGDGGRRLDMRLPLFLSFHPSEKMDFYASPKYIYQFRYSAEDGGNRHLFGSNFGLLFSSDSQNSNSLLFGFEIGLYNFYSSEFDLPIEMVSGGLGLQFIFK